MIRKDGKHVVFKDYFGDKVYKPAQSNTINPTVHIVKSNIVLNPNASWVDKINQLTQDDKYRKFISGIASYHVAAGHSVSLYATLPVTKSLDLIVLLIILVHHIAVKSNINDNRLALIHAPVCFSCKVS